METENYINTKEGYRDICFGELNREFEERLRCKFDTLRRRLLNAEEKARKERIEEEVYGGGEETRLRI